MIINVGDTIKTTDGKIGEIINIGIATEKTDIAAENETSLNAKTYDTEMNYIGAITYTCNGESPVKGTYWCYFDQIAENLSLYESKDLFEDEEYGNKIGYYHMLEKGKDGLNLYEVYFDDTEEKGDYRQSQQFEEFETNAKQTAYDYARSVYEI